MIYKLRARLHKKTTPNTILPVFFMFAVAQFNCAVHAYPQFQEFVMKHSRRATNCSMCHANDNGPIGNAPGQMGSLNKEELAELAKERSAMLPGQNVNSPLLNKFGNHIIETIGRAKFLQIIANPAQLAPALGDKSDLDGDGIPDSVEFLEGTDPLSKYNGDPWRLFCINLQRNWADELLTVLAALSLTYGISHYLKAITPDQSESSRTVEAEAENMP